MPLRFIVMGLAAVLVLAFIWHRSRRGAEQLRRELEPGQGITDEAAAAFEDVANQIIAGGESPNRSAIKPRSGGHIGPLSHSEAGCADSPR